MMCGPLSRAAYPVNTYKGEHSYDTANTVFLVFMLVPAVGLFLYGLGVYLVGLWVSGHGGGRPGLSSTGEFRGAPTSSSYQSFG
jgi:hypothetical protein